MLMPMLPAGPEGHSPRTVSRTVLVVSGTEKGRNVLKTMLEGSVYRPAAFAGNGGEARRALLSMAFDAVVINCPLPDEFGHELGRCAAEEGLGVLLAVKSELFEEVCAQVGGAGVLTVAKPMSRVLFSQALSLLDACRRQVELSRQESGRLRLKLDEVKTVCRAKCILVECLGLTESEAHRAIERRAMDQRLPCRSVAEEIVREYGEKGKAGVTLK